MNKPRLKLALRQRPPRLCIFPHCKEHMEQGMWMCLLHWSWVPSPERRVLMDEVTRLRELGQKKPSKELIEAVGLVRRAALLTQSKSEIAAKISDALDRPLVSDEAKKDLFREVEQEEVTHQRPGTFEQCAYLAAEFCEKCGWVKP